MKQIDELRLESELDYRFGYLTDFVGFGDSGIVSSRNQVLRDSR